MNTPHSFKEILPHDKQLFSGISLLEAIQLVDTPVDDLKKANGLQLTPLSPTSFTVNMHTHLHH